MLNNNFVCTKFAIVYRMDDEVRSFKNWLATIPMGSRELNRKILACSGFFETIV